jgi:tetratricopeptide (TPR) repeat protein
LLSDNPQREGEKNMTKKAQVSHEAEYYYRLALHGQHKEPPEKILEYFDRAIAVHPGHAQAWNEKANFLDYLGKCEDAVSCYDVAIRLDPEFSEAWFNKGMTLKKMGRESEGVACIKKGVECALGR